MRPRLRLSHKALILVIVPLAFELIFVTVLTGLLKQAEYETHRERHSKEVIADSNEIIKLFYDAGVALMGFGVTRSAAFSQRYEKAVEEIPELLRSLEILMQSGEEDSKKKFESVETVVNKSLVLLFKSRSQIDEKRNTMNILDAKEMRKEVETVVSQLVTSLHDFALSERVIQENAPVAQAKTRQAIMSSLMAGVITNVLLAVGLALFINEGMTRRLKILMDNTVRLVRRQPLNPPVAGTDEIAHLDLVFHDMAKALDEAARKRQELVSMVSHDLRSPLMSVEVSLSLLSAGALGQLSEKAHGEVSEAERNVTRLIKLINDLLDIERMEAGRLSMNPAKTILDQVFERSVDAIRAYAETKNLTLNVEETETLVAADEDRLVQVMVNLLANAIKFSPEGATIRIHSKSDPEWSEVRVTDEGPGIPLGFKDKIFDRFQQVDDETHKPSEGTGLGLAICKAIISGHSGTIGVDSEEGKGSSFWFRIPTWKK